MIEALIPDDVIGEQSGFLRIRPVVVDTSFLLADVLGSTRDRRRSTFLEAVEFGVLRPFAAHHVWAEMGRKVADVPGRHGLDRDVAAKVWWELYVPRIRFVDVAGLPVPSSSNEILGRDPSDAPTVALAGLLAPVVVLAGDRDLRDLGVAAQSYSAVVEHAGMLTVMSQGSWGSVVGLRLVAELVRWGYRSAGSGLRHPAGQMGALVGALLLLLTSDRWMPPVEERAPQWWRQAKSVVTDRLLPHIGELFSVYELAAQGFERASYDAADTSLVQTVARALAGNANPLNRTELSRLVPSRRVREAAGSSAERASTSLAASSRSRISLLPEGRCSRSGRAPSSQRIEPRAAEDSNGPAIRGNAGAPWR
jgi:hypothetical protein